MDVPLVGLQHGHRAVQPLPGRRHEPASGAAVGKFVCAAERHVSLWVRLRQHCSDGATNLLPALPLASSSANDREGRVSLQVRFQQHCAGTPCPE